MAYATDNRDRRRPWRRFAGRVAVVAGVVGVTMLGNLRLQASEIGHPFATRAPGTGVLANRTAATAVAEAGFGKTDPVPVSSGARPADDRFTAMVDDDETAADAAELVPAIYAWDKDVRFVYFRHVSKWM
jgi:hypothetical protein